MELKDKLRALREGKGWTQQDVADRLAEIDPPIPVTKTAVSNWELGLNRPSTDHLFKLALLYEVDVQWLRSSEPFAEASNKS